MRAGSTVASATVDANAMTMTFTLTSPLPAGAYQVKWVSIADDGDVLRQPTCTFTVAAAAASASAGRQRRRLGRAERIGRPERARTDCPDREPGARTRPTRGAAATSSSRSSSP